MQTMNGNLKWQFESPVTICHTGLRPFPTPLVTDFMNGSQCHLKWADKRLVLNFQEMNLRHVNIITLGNRTSLMYSHPLFFKFPNFNGRKSTAHFKMLTKDFLRQKTVP